MILLNHCAYRTFIITVSHAILAQIFLVSDDSESSKCVCKCVCVLKSSTDSGA